MNANGVAQIVFYLVVLTLLVPPLGRYIAWVYEGRRIPGLGRVFGPVERGTYRLLRIDPEKEQDWKGYTGAVLVFSAVGFGLLYLILRLQEHLPLNPLGLPGMSWSLAFNTSTSFITNTNWQFYAGESTLSYLSQMLGLTVQNFVSAAAGMAILAAVIRGFARRGSGSLGNFWADIVRVTLYVLIPLAVVWTLVLGSQGVMQTFSDPVTYQTLEARTLGTTGPDKQPLTQTIVRGPVASQIAIKQLGTNGGGYYNTNSATPLENPTPLSNFFEVLAILLIPGALTYTFGVMVGSRAQGWALYAAMMAILVVGIFAALPYEQRGSQVLRSTGVELSATANSPGGNLQDKEVRFGIANSVLWGTTTTAASNGSVNSGLDAWTGGAAVVPLTMLGVGEVVFGGVGSGLYGMLLMVLIAVFIGGLMVGRTPEYLGKKIEAREIKLASIGILAMPVGVLVLTAVAVSVGAGKASIFNAGPQGFAESLYAYMSQFNNNGSAMAGYGFKDFSGTLGGVAMLFGRFIPILAALGVAGALSTKKVTPAGVGTLRTASPTFVVTLIGVIILVAALTFVPAFVLGPVATQAGGLF
jgi:potassium-transporting ATPase potassium-binding subunit